MRAKRVVLGGEFASVRPSLGTCGNCRGLERPDWVLGESVVTMVCGRVLAHKQMLHWLDPQDLGAIKKIGGETSLWLSQKGGRRCWAKSPCSVWSCGDIADLVSVICSQDQSWYPVPEKYLQLWKWEPTL